MHINASIHRLARWFEAARQVVVLTGAGMSAESGIPTFRDGADSLWSRFSPQDLATARAYRRDKALVWGWYTWRMAVVRAVQPHAGHRALSELAGLKQGLSIVTQNVDDLHERAGSNDVIHLHGSLFASRCLACGKPSADTDVPPLAAQQPALRLMPPRCAHCGGDIRPGVVWFDESLPEAAWHEACELATQCDLLITIGSSGLVLPAANLPAMAGQHGAKVVEINPARTPLTDQADLSLQGTAGDVLGQLLAMVKA